MKINQSESKFRRESNTEKPSERLKLTSGQVDPKSRLDPKSKPKTKAEITAAKEKLQLDKSKLRADKSGAKLNKARKKLNSKKPRRKPGIIKNISSAAAFEVGAKIHGKINEVERENAAVESAHKAEIYGARAGRVTVRHVKQRIRTRPVRQVRKLEKQNIKANADFRFRELAKENPEIKKNALKKTLHKKRIQKQFQKQANETAKKAAKTTGKQSVSAVEKTGRAAVNFIKKNPKVALILGLCFFIVIILQSCAAMTMSLFNSLGGAVVEGTSYLAEDEEINEVGLRYSEWEIDLYLQAKDAENTHTGYDEYRYNLDTPTHDPYAMLAYLTARYNDFTFEQVQADLLDIFDEQYTLEFTPSTETRYMTVSGYDPETGTSSSETVAYDWHILTVTLTAQNFESVVMSRLTTQDEQERYAVNMMMKGNRQYIGNPLGVFWLPYVTSNYGYRVHPITGEKNYHTGVDLILPEGTPLVAGGVGVVVQSGDNGDYGLAILIDYGNGIQARYAHCSVLYFSAG